MQNNENNATSVVEEKSSEQTESVQVRATPAFKVRTVNVGVAVSAVSTNEQGQDLFVGGQTLPAIFTTLSDALRHIDQLRNLVSQHFDEAAQIGLQMIANQNNADASASASASVSEEIPVED